MEDHQSQQTEPLRVNPLKGLQSLIERVGGNGRYQWKLFLHFGCKWIIAGMLLFSLNFIYMAPQFQCTQKQLSTHKDCEEYVCTQKSQSFWRSHLKQPINSSISLDYEMVLLCSNKWIASLLQFSMYLGSLIGEIGMAYVADNYSRKKAQKYSWIICIMGIVWLVFSNDLFMVGVGTFLTGLGFNATTNLHYTFLKELLVGKYRDSSIVGLQILFSLGISLISVSSWLVPNWKVMMGLFILLPSIVLHFKGEMIEETPNISLKEGTSALIKSLNHIAATNNKPPLQEDEIMELQEQKQENYSIIDLFRYRSLRWITIICSLINLVIEFMYDASIFSLDRIGINLYVNQFVVGMVEMMAAVFGCLIVASIYRHNFIMRCMCFCAGTTLMIGISSAMGDYAVWQMVLMGILRFVLNCMWGIFFVYAAELFPSDITSLSLGFISAVSTVGGLVSPFVRLIAAKNTMFLMSGLCLVCVALLRLIPQTKGRALVQKIQERS